MTQYVVTHFGLDGLDEDNDEDADDEIVETHIRTFNNGDDFDTKKDDGLICPDRRVYHYMLGPLLRLRIIKPDNWVERNRIGLERVTCIESAHRSTCLRLKHNINAPLDLLVGNEEPIVWHEPDIDQYWDKMMKQLGGDSHKNCYSFTQCPSP